jgi:2-polyprenyl-3-methyl-5-hydroxy-6-metoxy-1,4-benzoquinol methylase
MDFSDKRACGESDVESAQTGNRRWWTDHTMSYDWNDRVQAPRFSDAWFEEIDRRFIHGARLFAHGAAPFDRILPFERLNGANVLEIGCGMGLHAELIARAGATLTAVDISDVSIEATRRRFELRGLSGDIRQMDARRLDFPAAAFDFVWSWGVVHHSARTAPVLKEIARVLRPGGEARLMVYHLDGMSAYATLARDWLRGFWRGRTIDECLWRRSDGHLARHYSRDMLEDILSAFFASSETETFGQDADALPLPRRLRERLLRRMPAERIAALANARGSLLFARATR